MDAETALRGQAEACGRLGSAMYADLLGRCADDLHEHPRDGDVARVLSSHDDDPGPSALALRLMGSVHRLVLERRAGALGTFYPSVGGTWSPSAAEACWAAFRSVLAERPDDVVAWLDRPPQTNEVGRSAALAAGLLHLHAVTGLPVRLVEIGSSGGLNLRADLYRYGSDVGTHGPASPLVLAGAWSGPGPWTRAGVGWPDVVERSGSDVMPIDVATTEGRLALTAYVWADQAHRHERLRGALAVAAAHPVVVERRTAADVAESLELRPGTLTVFWHSVMWQYLDRAEQDRVSVALAALGERATPDAQLAHLFHEPTRPRPGAEHRMLLGLERWDGAGCRGERELLADVHSHGVPTRWYDAAP